MLLSIIIRCFDRLEYTIRTIVSIDEHVEISKSLYEIICIDQDSSDGTKEWLNETQKEGYYPLKVISLERNRGDGKGMQVGINVAEGKFIAQHDNDIEICSDSYFRKLIDIYEILEKKGWKVCAVGGSHVQGVNKTSAPWRFGRDRYPVNRFVENGNEVYAISWVTGSFIFRREFSCKPFGSGMCNAWCSAWWDEGYNNFLCPDINFWHIDSGKSGEHVSKQARKFPSYKYIKRHYGKFI